MPKREKPASKLQFKVVVDEQQSGSDNMDQKVVTLMQGFSSRFSAHFGKFIFRNLEFREKILEFREKCLSLDEKFGILLQKAEKFCALRNFLNILGPFLVKTSQELGFRKNWLDYRMP